MEYKPLWTVLVVRVDKLNVRRGASADYALVGVAKKGMELPMIDYGSGNWSKVFFKKEEAYIEHGWAVQQKKSREITFRNNEHMPEDWGPAPSPTRQRSANPQGAVYESRSIRNAGSSSDEQPTSTSDRPAASSSGRPGSR